MNNLKDIHNSKPKNFSLMALFYQDVNEQFEGYTQHQPSCFHIYITCFIRMSMNNLKDIHNRPSAHALLLALFYQDVNEQFEGYTQQAFSSGIRLMLVLSGCQ